MEAAKVIEELVSMRSPANIEGQARFGIRPAQPLGISVTKLRKMAKTLGKDHELAQGLWRSGFNEARILASMIDEVDAVTPQQMDDWVAAFDSWDLCDQVCGNLFDRTPFIEEKSREWIRREEEFVKRAGAVLLAESAVHLKQASDEMFVDFLPFLVEASTDQRNFVKKGVSWSFRQIAKRNDTLRSHVLAACEPLLDSTDRTTRWIAKDVVKELRR